MFGSDLVFGIAIMAAGLVVVLVAAVLILRRRGSHGRGEHGEVPPPVDPGTPHPEQARDINAEKKPGQW